MKFTNAMLAHLPFTVIRDDREKAGHGWTFGPLTEQGVELCRGTEIRRLATADYTLDGFEDVLAIERKANIAEFVKSITDRNFELELRRMESIDVAQVILEFGIVDLMNWPKSAGLSPYVTRKLPFQGSGVLLSMFSSLMVAHPHIGFTFAEFYGRDLALKLFKRTIEIHSRSPVRF